LGLSDALRSDPLVAAERALRRGPLRAILGGFVDVQSLQHAFALCPFAEDRPWRYWDRATTLQAIEVLEADPDRTADALHVRSAQLGAALDSLFTPAPARDIEDSLDHDRPRDLVAISTTFHPEYLRWSEHVFGPLLSLYWSVLKKGGAAGNFGLRGATAAVASRRRSALLVGYNEQVRNALAHGNVVFRGSTIAYGQQTELTSAAFLRLFDDLCRTCNAMALAALIYILRDQDGARLPAAVSPGLLRVILAGAINRRGCTVDGVVESTPALVGTQLHVSVSMASKSRPECLFVAFRVATVLADLGVREIDRLMVGIDHGDEICTDIPIKYGLVPSVLNSGATPDALQSLLGDTPLLWFDEVPLVSRLRLWRNVARLAWRTGKQTIIERWHEVGACRGKGRFTIRRIDNLSVRGLPRVHIVAVLNDPCHADDPDIVRETIRELTRVGRHHRVWSRPSPIDRGISLLKRPKHVFVDLYREDGTVRWLVGPGWSGGNLIVTSEGVWGRAQPVHVKNPQECYAGIAIRYEIDEVAAHMASAELARTLTDIYENRDQGQSSQTSAQSRP